MLAYIKRCICERVGCIHEVDTSKVFVRRHDVQRILALDIHKVGQTSTRSDEDTLEAFSLELVDSYRLSNYAVGMFVVKMFRVHPSEESQSMISSRQSPSKSAVRLGVFFVLLQDVELS